MRRWEVERLKWGESVSAPEHKSARENRQIHPHGARWIHGEMAEWFPPTDTYVRTFGIGRVKVLPWLLLHDNVSCVRMSRVPDRMYPYIYVRACDLESASQARSRIRCGQRNNTQRIRVRRS